MRDDPEYPVTELSGFLRFGTVESHRLFTPAAGYNP
jgi:hypothetical protein